MNIFAVDECPLIAASQLCDKHVVKMVLETAQLASTTFHTRGLDAPYRKTHENHPSAVWARTSRQNFEWMMLHMSTQHATVSATRARGFLSN